MSDPFTQVYDALWELAETTPTFTRLVKLGNRIKYTSPTGRNPEKSSTLSDGDFPEVILSSEGLNANMWNTSNSSMCVRKYSWLITTGDFRLSYRLYPVEWAVFVAMHGWREKLGALLWAGKSYCKRMAITDVLNGIIRPKSEIASPEGWSAIWSCEVEMHFDANELVRIRTL